jgi:hypothetical protein
MRITAPPFTSTMLLVTFEWKETQFDAKNYKPVPESFIWRFLL